MVGTDAVVIAFPLKRSFGWYDISVAFDGFPDYGQRFAGRYETGKTGTTDPFMGRTI
jgi:phospholipase C